MENVPHPLWSVYTFRLSLFCHLFDVGFVSKHTWHLIWNMEVKFFFTVLGQYLLISVMSMLLENRKKCTVSLTNKHICTLQCYRSYASEQIWSCRQFAVTNLRRDEWVWMSRLLAWKQVTHKLGEICGFFVIWVIWQS